MNVTSSAASSVSHAEQAWLPAQAGPAAAEAGSPVGGAAEGVAGPGLQGLLGAQAVPGVQAARLDAADPAGVATALTAREGADERSAGGTHVTLSEMARANGLPGNARASDVASALLPAGAAMSGAGQADGAAAAATADASSQARTVAADASAPLAPALLTALQAGATLLRRSTWRDEARRQGGRPSRDGRGGDPREHDDDNGDVAVVGEGDGEGDNERGQRRRDLPSAPHTHAAWVAEPPPWAAELLVSLRREAARPPAQAALSRAMEAWRCGRAVLLACPQAAADPAAGWLFVLWPGDTDQQPSLQGQRFAARLAWNAPQGGGRWWAVKVAKVHSVRQGRQLSTLAAGIGGAAAAVDCEIQLGPFPLTQPRWREVLVRVDAVQRLWSALDVLWSLPLLVCDSPLVTADAARAGDVVR